MEVNGLLHVLDTLTPRENYPDTREKRSLNGLQGQ